MSSTHDKPKSHLRARWWVLGGLFASMAMVLVVNVLLVSESADSSETTRFKAYAKAKSNIEEANTVNLIVLDDTVNSTEPNGSSSDSSIFPIQILRVSDPSQSEASVGKSGELIDTTASRPLATPRIYPPTHNIRSDYEVEDALDLAPKRVNSPEVWPPLPGSQDECLYLHDYGLLERLSTLSSSHCVGDARNSPYTFYHVPAIELKATKLDNFVLDMRNAQVAQSISSLAQDGGGHDPRFKYTPNSSFCTCAGPQTAALRATNIWEDLVAERLYANDVSCRAPTTQTPRDVATVQRAVVVVRKDDHNPFFQISGILNAWVMMRVLGWGSSSTQLVTLDRALPSPVDDLRHTMLGPDHPVIGGDELQKHVVRFDTALLSPYEARGPMMSHLNDDQPCYANEMIRDFRDEALRTMKVAAHKTDPKRCLVTVISRRPYGGRRIQRVWRNEDEILSQMRSDYKSAYRFGECEFQSLDFVNMTMHDQMQVMVDSDVVIGMHGAGMVNVMWTRPETLVVEIFPLRRWRWGYRNLCQYLGCSWREFRGGSDVFVQTTDPNDMDKRLWYDEWKRFFDPLFRDAIAKLGQQFSSS